MNQLPESAVDGLMQNYLYKEFLEQFDRHFQIPKQNSFKHARYTWSDRPYRDYMVSMLNQLEPIQYEKNQIVFEELDEYSEVVFLKN